MGAEATPTFILRVGPSASSWPDSAREAATGGGAAAPKEDSARENCAVQGNK